MFGPFSQPIYQAQSVSRAKEMLEAFNPLWSTDGKDS